MIRDVVRFTLIAYALGAAGLLASSLRLDANARRARLIKLATYFVIVQGFVFAAYVGRTALLAVCAAVAAVGTWEFSGALGATRLTPGARLLAWLGFLAVALSLLVLAGRRSPEHVLFAYLIVAVFDGFSQVTGQLAGRHPLAPSVSPAKTIEGFAGGAAAALVAAYWLRQLAGLTSLEAAAVTAALVVAALAGDLAASAIKRQAGLKDYSGALPGHGGMLDRFDSLLGAAPIACLLL